MVQILIIIRVLLRVTAFFLLFIIFKLLVLITVINFTLEVLVFSLAESFFVKKLKKVLDDIIDLVDNTAGA